MLKKIAVSLPILLLTAGHGAVDSYLGLLQVLAPGLAAHMDVPLGDVIMLVGVAGLVTNLIQPLAGFIMGTRNMAWALWLSVFLSALPVLMGFMPGFWPLVAVILLGAVGTGLYHPEATLAAHDATGEKAYLGIPLFMAGGAAIYALAVPLSIRLTESFGFHALAWLGIPGVGVAAVFLYQHRDHKRKRLSRVIRPRSRRETKALAGGMSFWPLFTVGCCFCVGSGLFLSILASHYELLFGPSARQWAGWVLMALGISASLCSFAWGALSQRYDFYLLALISQLAALPLFLLLANPASPQIGFLIAIPLGVVTPAAIHPVGVTLSRNAAGATQAMRTSLMIGGAYGLASLAVMAAGVLLRRGVPSPYLIYFVAFCSLAAIIVSLWQLRLRNVRGQTATGKA